MSHPDPHGPTDRTPIQVGEIWENPVTRERAQLLELPYKNPEGRATAELTALVGARVVGEHRHPAMVEKFTVLKGELTVKRNGSGCDIRITLAESSFIGRYPFQTVSRPPSVCCSAAALFSGWLEQWVMPHGCFFSARIFPSSDE